MNRVPGEPLFVKDLNCHCIDPYADLVLNPRRGRTRRRDNGASRRPSTTTIVRPAGPTEEIGVGRIFRIGEGKSVRLRGELFNAFNPVYLNSPTSGNPAASVTRNARGELTGGFGFINPASVANPPRNAQLLLRVQF